MAVILVKKPNKPRDIERRENDFSDSRWFHYKPVTSLSVLSVAIVIDAHNKKALLRRLRGARQWLNSVIHYLEWIDRFPVKGKRRV